MSDLYSAENPVCRGCWCNENSITTVSISAARLCGTYSRNQFVLHANSVALLFSNYRIDVDQNQRMKQPAFTSWANRLFTSMQVVLTSMALAVLVPASSAYSAGPDVDHAIETTVADREVAVVNGRPIAYRSFPTLTALLTGRRVSIWLNGQIQIGGFFFGHGLNRLFNGDLVDCGTASSVCANVAGGVCLIETGELLSDQTPASQLANCASGGGVGAVFVPGSKVLRTDMYDGVPQIPAVFINETRSRELLRSAVANATVRVEIEPEVSETILCGATYLGGQWVLTAAHCVLESTPDGVRKLKTWEITASVGAHDLTRDQHLAMAVEEIFITGDLTQNLRVFGDIALLKLRRLPTVPGYEDAASSTESTIKVVATDEVRQKAVFSAPAIVLGWGSTSARDPGEARSLTNSTSPIPRSASVSLLPLDQCSAKWNDYLLANNLVTDVMINTSQLCAFEPITGRDTCQGDSGGPMLIDVNGELELAGITSFGLGCGSTGGVPAVYTNVSMYADWINQTTGLNVSDSSQPRVSVSSLPANVTSGVGSVDTSLLLPIVCLMLISLIGGCHAHPRDRSNSGMVYQGVEPAGKTDEKKNWTLLFCLIGFG